MSDMSNAAPSAPQMDSSAQSPSLESSESENSTLEGASQEQSVENLQDLAQNGTAAEQKAAKKMLKSLKLKVDGREIEEKLPFEIPDDEETVEWMKRNLQMSKMGQKRAQEYSTLEKEVKTFIEELRKNPRKILADPRSSDCSFARCSIYWMIIVFIVFSVNEFLAAYLATYPAGIS